MPPLPHLALLFFLGGAFLHFTLAGARTFHFKPGDAGPGELTGYLFLFGGTIPVWWLGLYRPIHLLNGLFAAGVLLVSIALYEWSRAVIWGRRFGLGWSDHVPEELCDRGPYGYVRNPIYLSYVLATIAALVALPHWITALIVVVYTAVFVHAAATDERRIAASPLAAAYAEYRKRVGMFIPRVRRSTHCSSA